MCGLGMQALTCCNVKNTSKRTAAGQYKGQFKGAMERYMWVRFAGKSTRCHRTHMAKVSRSAFQWGDASTHRQQCCHGCCNLQSWPLLCVRQRHHHPAIQKAERVRFHRARQWQKASTQLPPPLCSWTRRSCVVPLQRGRRRRQMHERRLQEQRGRGKRRAQAGSGWWQGPRRQAGSRRQGKHSTGWKRCWSRTPLGRHSAKCRSGHSAQCRSHHLSSSYLHRYRNRGFPR